MKKILFTLAAISLASVGFAQDFGFDSDSGDSFDSYESSGTPEVTISGEVGTEGRAWIGTKNSEGNYDSTGYDGFYDVSKTALDANAYANLELNYEGEYTGANIKLKLDAATIKEYPEDVLDEVSATGSFKEGKFQLKAGKMKEVWGKGDKVHVLDNFNANNYTDFIFPDYIDRRLGEIMFKATANLSWDYNLKLEGIFTPWMTADRFAGEKSPLYPNAQRELTDTVTSFVKKQAASQLKGYIGLSGTGTKSDPYKIDLESDKLIDGLNGLSNFSADSLYGDTNLKSLKYGQAGARITGTLGGIDWGASYYYGHYKQPSANLNGIISLNAYGTAAEKYAKGAQEATAAATTYTELAYIETDPVKKAQYQAAADQYTAAAQEAGAKATALATAATTTLNTSSVTDMISLNYDQLQVFGLEAAFVLWKFNTRWEFAYNLTEDIAGDNPWIKNNSISWVAGFDIDIPLHNLNLNVQDNGSYILNSDKIKNGGINVAGLGTLDWDTLGKNYDVDGKSDNKYYSNKLIVLLSDKWMNEKLTTEVQGIWGIERNEFMVAPKIEYNVTEGLTFALRGVYLYSNNEDGEFYNFTAKSENHDKTFVQLTAKYQF